MAEPQEAAPARSSAASLSAEHSPNTITTTTTTEPGRPTEELDIADDGGAAAADQNPGADGWNEDDIVYPSGVKLWMSMASLAIAYFLNGLDLTIVAVAVPSLTDEFKTVDDIGWYNAAYGLTMSAFVFFFGKAYAVFPIKTVFVISISIFEAGSLLCTLAPSSRLFILGRAIAGVGSGGIGGGFLKMTRHCFPLRKQALVVGLIGACQSVGLAIAPAVGGALVDAFSWRACFGINLPLGVCCIALTIYGFHDPLPREENGKTFAEKVRASNPLDTLLMVPSITCFLLALQWGGATYGWNNWRIILLLVLFVLLLSAFVYFQYRRGENATVPLRIAKMRTILGGMWVTACCNGLLAVTEYYISIYFQGVRGFTPTKSGLLGLPMIVGLSIASLLGAFATNAIGYYFPNLVMTGILAPIASGLLTTIDLDGTIAKPAALLGFLGFAVGISIQSPQIAVQASLSPKDVSIGGSIILFGAGMGAALWVCASATLFRDRLFAEIAAHSPGTNASALANSGLSNIRKTIGPERLQSALTGYNDAVVQTLYLPLALGIATLIGTLAMEQRTIKTKQA